MLLNQYFAQNIIQPNQVLTQETISAGQTPPIQYVNGVMTLTIPPYPMTVMSHQTVIGITTITINQIPMGDTPDSIRMSSIAEAVGQTYDYPNSDSGTASGEYYNRPKLMPANGGKVILKLSGTGIIDTNSIKLAPSTGTNYYISANSPAIIDLSTNIVVVEIVNITTGNPIEILSQPNDIFFNFIVYPIV